MKSRAAITCKISVHPFHSLLDNTRALNKLRAHIQLRTSCNSCGWAVHQKASDHHTSPCFWESFSLQPHQQDRLMAISRILKSQRLWTLIHIGKGGREEYEHYLSSMAKEHKSKEVPKLFMGN